MGKTGYCDKILQHAPFGFAYHRVICDDSGNPVDFIFLNVNASFEKMLNCTRDEILDKKASEVLPAYKDNPDKWINIVREVFKTGQPREVKHYSEYLRKWYSVHIYSPEKEHFSAIFQDVTSQKDTEEQLLISDKVFQYSMDLLCVAGNDGYFKSLNPAWSKTLGWTTEELLSRPWLDFVHPDDRHQTENAKTAIVYGEQVHHFENRYRCSDGSYKWLSWNSIPVPGQEVMVGVARNITQLKTATNALKESLDRNKAILQAIPDMMFVFDREGVFVDYYSNDIGRLLMEPKYFMGKKDTEVLPEQVAKINQDALSRVFATGQLQTYSYSLEIDGEKRHFESLMTLMGDDKALSFIRDVTDHMNAELQLAQSEEKFRLIFETAPLGFLHFDCEGIVTSCNQKLISILGSSAERIVGIDLTAHPDSAIADMVKKVLSGQQGTYEGIYTTLSSGKSTPLKIQAAPIRKTGKQCNGGIATIEDRTLHHEREEFERQMAVAREAVKFKQNFLANMSHEIRTPLTGIMGIIDILSQSGHDREHLEILKNTSENLLEVLNQVLDYSKIEAGKIQIKRSAFSFHQMVNDLVSLYNDVSLGGVKVSAHIAPQVPAIVEADRGRISQIMNNLLNNAVKFTVKGSIKVEAQLAPMDNCLEESGTSDKMCIRVSVIDTGIGISKEKQERLFAPFVQVEDPEKRNYDGTGLGLSVCKHLAELHGGRVGVESEPGKGSTFWFTFFAGQVKSNGIEKAQPADHHQKVFSLRILLAEIKPSTRR